MLQNEILSKIPERVYSKRQPNVDIKLSLEDIDILIKKYHISEDEILTAIDIFSGIDINSASITLPNGKKSFIDSNGTITTEYQQIKRNDSVGLYI